MKKGIKTHRILLSFVGTNDAGRLRKANEGAILTIFKELLFDEVYLLWNPTKYQSEFSFKDIAEHVRDEILKKDGSQKVMLQRFDCKDVTDHNEIYPKLLDFCRSLPQNENYKYTAAIASGTPAMQVCWILIAESGDFPLDLIRSNEPKFGKPYVKKVKLGIELPRIVRLEHENLALKEGLEHFIPQLVINVKKGDVVIGDRQIPFSPIEFSYYRYFVERLMDGTTFERFSGLTMPEKFLKSIVEYHKESFPDSELFRLEIMRMLKSKSGLSISTFRANVTKANNKIRKALGNPGLAKLFEISRQGKRHAMLYGINLPASKIKI